jgi:hypothetical protein
MEAVVYCVHNEEWKSIQNGRPATCTILKIRIKHKKRYRTWSFREGSRIYQLPGYARERAGERIQLFIAIRWGAIDV